MKYTIRRTVNLPGGGDFTVEIHSSAPINKDDYLILRPDAGLAMAECLVDLANALRPSGSGEISLEKGGPNA